MVSIFCRIIGEEKDFLKVSYLDEVFQTSKIIKVKLNDVNITNSRALVKLSGVWVNNSSFEAHSVIEYEEGYIVPQGKSDNIYFRSNTTNSSGFFKCQAKYSRLTPFRKYYTIISIDKDSNYIDVLFIREMKTLNLKTEKILSINRHSNEVLANTSNLESDDNVKLSMKHSDYYSKANYIIDGYWEKDIFRSVISNELIEAKIRTLSNPKINKNNLKAFCKAEFLKYPKSRKPPTNEVYISGTFASIFKDDDFDVKGFWRKTKKSVIFEVVESKRVFGTDKKTIKNFLTLALRGSGIGPVTVDRILDEFGTDSINAIEADHLQLIKIPRINEEKAGLIYERVVEAEYLSKTMSYLIQNNVDNNNIIRIFKKFGIKSVEMIKKNPYIITDIPGISFFVADEIAKNEKFLPTNKIRLENALIHYLKEESEGKGDLFTFKDNVLLDFNSFLKKRGAFQDDKDCNISEQDILEIINQAKISKSITEEVYLHDGRSYCIYLSYNNYIENNIVKRLKIIKDSFKTPLATKDEIRKFISDYEDKYGLSFANKQKEAIVMALTEGVSILTGGPGTGKTHTINAIIKATKFLKPTAYVELCAPTGKASERMAEMTNEEAMTIHRRLKYIPFENEDNLEIIDGDLLVIDESSMIDANLFLKLLENVDEDTRILFVGDHNQIPSVGAGSVFRDLIVSKQVPTTILDEVFRQAEDSNIIVNSHKIINGITTDKGLDISNKKDFKFYNVDNQIDIQEKIIEIIDRKISSGEYKMDNVQVLTLMNVGDLGIHELNYHVQEKFNKKNEGYQITPFKTLKLNDRVMQTKNNYDLNVFNGSVGTISRISSGSDFEIDVNYDGEVITYSEGEVDELVLAYSMTIHKSQGSEFPLVIIPIHSSHTFMNNRNLIYTAITRAKSEVILVGSETVLNEVILKIDNIDRNSQVIEKLNIE